VSFGVRLTVAYDGTEFAGFQVQPGQRTVAGALADAAQRVCRHDVTIRGASRTDAGVHAEGQVAAFACERELPATRWLLALNRYLPPDVAVRACEPCAPDYEPRFDALDKTYRYLFHLGSTRDPLLRRNAWHLGRRIVGRVPAPGPGVGVPLALDAMRAACARLEGTHDFRAFRAAADKRENTTRTLQRVALYEGHAGQPALLALEVRGDAFMMNMVRILAGTLVEVGCGRLSPDDVSSLLSARGERRDAGMTAPPHGLTLVAVTLGRLRSVRAPASR
jgi:tRNA pseudouridine38-40 synthase